MIRGVRLGGSLFGITGLFKYDQRGLSGRITVWFHLGCSNMIRGIWLGGSLFGITGAVQIWSEVFDWEDHCLVLPWLLKCDQRYLTGRITVLYHQGCSNMIRGVCLGGSLFGITRAASLGGSLFGITGAVQMWSEGFDWEDDCLVSLGLFKCDQRDLTGWITVWYHLDCSDVISEVWPGGSLFCITLTDQIKSEVFDWEDSCLVSPWLFKCDQRYLTGRITVWFHLGCSNMIRGVWLGGWLFGITGAVQMWSEGFDRVDHCLVPPWLFRCDQWSLTGRITVLYHLDWSDKIRSIWLGG